MTKSTKTTPTARDLHFTSDDLTIEGELRLPDSTGKFPGVVICHPHPRYGGDMHNNVVMGVAGKLLENGIAVFRFNFRGVGNSEGTITGGVGEVQDAIEAVANLALQDDVDGSRIGIIGYSFGASIALEASVSNIAIQAVMSVACPMAPFREVGVQEIVQPKLLVCGELDHDFPSKQFLFLSKRFEDPKQVELVYGADHFFNGMESELGDMATTFFSPLIGSGAR